MCWDYSECGCCGERTYCIVYCDHNEEEKENGFCEHRDCKSFNTCDTCHQDLCDVCYAIKCKICNKSLCEECKEDSKIHPC